jgi:hypothetical protein
MEASKSDQDAALVNRPAVAGSSFWVMCLLLTACSTVPAAFHPVSPIAPGEVSDRLLQNVLSQAVSEGIVDYTKIQQDPRFWEHVDRLSRVDPNGLPSKADRLAWWINAYNAFAIRGILDGETPRPYLGWYRYFKVREYSVGGVNLNLYDLEHQILRKEFHEPRIHFAIVCASVSCPRLQSWVYEGGQLDRQLDRAAREFLNDPTKNRFDRRRMTASLSKIFEWFEEDFVAAAGSVQAYVSRFVDDPDLARELSNLPYRIEYLEYDWSLNGVPPREAERADPS